MREKPNADDVSRRDVLKNATLVTGAVFVGGTALVGNSAASATRNFAYQSTDDPDVKGRTWEFVDKGGKGNENRQHTPCGANIKTQAFTVEEVDGDGTETTLYAIPTSYEVGDTVSVAENAVTSCPSEYEEVAISLVD